MIKKINKLEKKLNIKFKNIFLLERSITHKSYDSNNNYEILEFLGDRVLNLVISKKLIDLYPNEKEGVLDKKLASLVNKNRCYEIGKFLNLDQFIKIGNKKNESTNIEKKVISDTCEALIGAIFLDNGFYYTEKFILKIWKNLIKESNIVKIDSKTKLQEYSLKEFKTLPIYKIISSTGPKHKPIFIVAVKLKNTNFVESRGSSIKNAEQSAANELLKKIKLL